MTYPDLHLPPRILALDLGKRRTGIALACVATGLATPHSTVELPFERLLAHVRALADDEGCGLVVIGDPRLPSGDPSEIGAYARKVAAALESAGTRAVLWDEGLTSWEAGEILRRDAAGRKKTRRAGRAGDRGEVDRLAAALLLQDFLDHHARPTTDR